MLRLPFSQRQDKSFKLLIRQVYDGKIYLGDVPEKAHSDNPEKAIIQLWGYLILALQSNDGFEDVCKAYLAANDLGCDGMAVLSAHGNINSDGQWCFAESADDNEIERKSPLIPIQSWIDEHDDEESILFLWCCNPDNQGVIKAKRALVIHMIDTFVLSEVLSRKNRLRMFVPGIGYFDPTNNQAVLQKVVNKIQAQGRAQGRVRKDQMTDAIPHMMQILRNGQLADKLSDQLFEYIGETARLLRHLPPDRQTEVCQMIQKATETITKLQARKF